MKAIAAFLFLIGLCGFQDNSMQAERNKMVNDQIVARGIKDKATLDAMRKVPRHLFVPSQLVEKAYFDHPLSIGYGQTISQPYIVAYMTEALQLQASDRVLEIGTGSGYQAAILAEIVNEVVTIEIVKPLAMEAKERLTQLGYSNVTVLAGDGYQGYKPRAPYNAIVVTAAPESIPPPLLEQLAEGGRMVIPVGAVNAIQYLKLVERKNGKIIEQSLLPVRFVPFTGEAEGK